MRTIKNLSVEKYVAQEYDLFDYMGDLSEQMPFDDWKGLEFELDIGEDLLKSYSHLSPDWLVGLNLNMLFKVGNFPIPAYGRFKRVLDMSSKRKIMMLFAHGVEGASEFYAEHGRVVNSKTSWIYEHSMGKSPEYAAHIVVSCNPQRKELNASRVPLFYVKGNFRHGLSPINETVLSLPSRLQEGDKND